MPRWTVATTSRKRIAMLRELLDQYECNGNATIPTFRPLAVDDMVFMHTPYSIVGVDLRGGKRVWVYPGREVPQEAAPWDWQRRWLIQRSWYDVVHARMSTNGERLFVLQDLGQDPFRDGGRALDRPSATNTLTSLDFRGGRVNWVVGGDLGGDEPNLKGAFFLNAPAVAGERLYVLTEMITKIHLAVVDAKNGRLLWSFVLRDVGMQAIEQDRQRRLAGGSVALSGNIAICLTSAGEVFGIDVKRRRRLWCHEYERRDDTLQATTRGPLSSIDERWVEPMALICARRVLVAPAVCGQLFCLDLHSGDCKWELGRRQGLYLDRVDSERALVIGKHDVVAIRTSDGSPLWAEPVQLGKAIPSGRGVFLGECYYLPTNASDVFQIDVPTGAIVRRRRTDSVLGNLLFHRGEVISQSVTALATFGGEEKGCGSPANLE
jgi:outer membrane protein assembly factor BamB